MSDILDDILAEALTYHKKTGEATLNSDKFVTAKKQIRSHFIEKDKVREALEDRKGAPPHALRELNTENKIRAKIRTELEL